MTLIIEGITIEAISKGTNFEVRISPVEAARLLKNNSDQHFDIMCMEYGQDSDWVGVQQDDLNEEGLFEPEYQTFEIWLDAVCCQDLSRLPEAKN